MKQNKITDDLFDLNRAITSGYQTGGLYGRLLELKDLQVYIQKRINTISNFFMTTNGHTAFYKCVCSLSRIVPAMSTFFCLNKNQSITARTKSLINNTVELPVIT